MYCRCGVYFVFYYNLICRHFSDNQTKQVMQISAQKLLNSVTSMQARFLSKDAGIRGYGAEVLATIM